MSEDNLQKLEGEEPGTTEQPGEETFDVTLNRETNELKFKDPTTGRVITFKATDETPHGVDERGAKKEEQKPLAPDDFRAALQKTDALGLTWTGDVTPGIRAKKPENEGALLSPEFIEIRNTYPHLPREVGSVAFYALTGSKPPATVVGNEDDLQKKVATVLEFVVTADFRSEFFFKHAIKVPYLSDIDWEVVFKLGERNVRGMPAISYALLSLFFNNPNAPGGRHRAPETMTVAVNYFLVNKLIEILTEVKDALEEARQLAVLGVQGSALKGESDDERTTEIPKQLV